jgi:hypothetical protein
VSRAQCVVSPRGTGSKCTDDLQKKERRQGYSGDDRQDRAGDGEGSDG